MAEENTVATWGGLEIQLVSEEVVAVVDAAKAVLEVINATLDIGLQIAQIAKTFVTSNLNLARAAVNELLALLRGIAQDLLNVGLYANLDDLRLLRANKANIKGGYDGWERRMITRLNDRNDPNRPDFSESTTVVAMFVYVGVPDYKLFEGQYFNRKYFDPIVQCVEAFGALFGLGSKGQNQNLPIAANLRAEYSSPQSSDPALVLAALKGNSKIKVVWESAPAPGGSDQDPSPQPPSSGYIVEVSCYATGFQTGWIAPATAGTGSTVPGAAESAQAYTTGQYLKGSTGQSLTIFGGEDTIDILPEVAWPDGYTPGSGTLPAGNTPLYFYLDPSAPEPIIKAFGKSADGRTYYNQRAFFVPERSVFTQMVAGANYTFELKKEELPKFCPIVNGRMDTALAQDPQTVYVRVTPVTNRITEANYTQARWTPRARHDDNAVLVNIVCTSGNAEPPIGNSDFGIPSEVLEVTIPTVNQDLYSKAVQTAIAVLVLSRSDLTAPDPITENAPPDPATQDRTYRPTGLESAATEVFRWMNVQNPSDYFSRRNVSPTSFTDDLYTRIVEQADRYIRTQGALPPSVLNAMSSTLHDLVNWKWSDAPDARNNQALRYTILESLTVPTESGLTPVTPLAMNRYDTKQYYSGTTPADVLNQLSEKWSESGFGVSYHRASVDAAPVVGPSLEASPQYWYARQLIPESIYQKARMVLNITSNQSARRVGSWVATKPFTVRAPTGRLLSILNKVEGASNLILAGAQTGADAILRFISFLEQRVREIQETIKRIDALLDLPFRVPVPEAKALLLITNGSSGIVTGLLQAEGKPQEGPGAYAGGIVLVAGGGVPRVLIELLSAGIRSAGD